MNRGVKLSNKDRETVVDSNSTIISVGEKKKPAKKKTKVRTKKTNILFVLKNKVAVDFNGDGMIISTKKQFKKDDKVSLKYTGVYPHSIKIVGID